MRRKQPSLRGSVQQNTSTVRMRVRENPRFGIATRLAIGGGLLLIVIVAGFWSWHSGFIHRQIAAIEETTLRWTQKAHFAVTDIIVEGRQQTNKDQLYVALDVTSGSPIFAFKPSEAETRIAKLPWVESVTVERRLPDTLYVRLTERVPLARWQHDNHLAVIDKDGKILADADATQFAYLPLFVGAGAPEESKNLLDTLHNFPTLVPLVVAAVRVGERRWDLHLPGNIVARLPETGVADALKRLSILITEQKILERDIVAIDLRMPDRLIIEPGSNTAQHPTGEKL